MLNNLFDYIQQNGQDIITALGQHIEISLIAMIITIVIAIPLAIFLMNYRRAGEFFLQIASVVQTIPSLAILGLLIPFVGIGTVPAVIALVLYAIMPVYQNTYSGLTNIDPLLIEAADAMGVTRRYKLFRVQLPLAMPMIISGIRIGFVMIIGTATLAALIGGGGLGTFILVGIQSNNNSALLVGAILSAVLALLAGWIINLLTNISLKKMAIGLGVVVVLFGGSYVVQMATTPKVEEVTIAGKLGGEPEILINMYKDLIEADHKNIKVNLKRNFGGTSFLFKALQSGQIDIYPEFTGTVTQSILKDSASGKSAPAVYDLAKTGLADKYKMTYLKPMAYQNGYAIVVDQKTAQTYQLKTISDLKNHPEFLAGFDPDFYQQPDGYPGLKKDYDLNFENVKTMEPSLKYRALANGDLQVINGYTTDPEIQEYNLVVLKDDLEFFPPYQGAPLMMTKFANDNPDIVKSLNKLAGKISTSDMQEMNYQVTVKHEKAATVAREYLVDHNLID